MKTLIISDTHLTHNFDSGKFHYLRSLISHYDRVVINGDFWDGYETTFNRFISSRWNELFPLLLEKNTIYLYGNHDKKRWTPRPELFSVEQFDRYFIPIGKYELMIEHGHRIAPSFDITYPRLSYVLSAFFSSRRFQFGKLMEGEKNMQMKHFAKKNLSPNQVLVCGHSHIAENNKKQKFMNTGMIDYGVASYLSVDKNTFALHTETYE